MRYQQSNILYIRFAICILCSYGTYGYHICSHRTVIEKESALYC